MTISFARPRTPTTWRNIHTYSYPSLANAPLKKSRHTRREHTRTYRRIIFPTYFDFYRFNAEEWVRFWIQKAPTKRCRKVGEPRSKQAGDKSVRAKQTKPTIHNGNDGQHREMFDKFSHMNIVDLNAYEFAMCMRGNAIWSKWRCLNSNLSWGEREMHKICVYFVRNEIEMFWVSIWVNLINWTMAY